MNQEKIERILTNKRANLPAGVSIVTPDTNMSVELQGDWLIALLQRMYTQHALTSNRDQLIDSLSSGVCRCWFAHKDQQPIASAALIEQSDGAVELGRATSFEPGVGSVLMLMAALDHLTRSSEPLVTETRVPKAFEGIPSGIATQIICFNHLDLAPHALLPAFGHGSPLRKEPFVITSSHQIFESEPLAIPDGKRASSLVFTAFMLG